METNVILTGVISIVAALIVIIYLIIIKLSKKRAKVQKLELQVGVLKAEKAHNISKATEWENWYAKVHALYKQELNTSAGLRYQNEQLKYQSEGIRHQNEQLKYQSEGIRHQNEKLRNERDNLTGSYDNLVGRYNKLIEGCSKEISNHQLLKTNYNKALSEKCTVENELIKIRERINNYVRLYKALKVDQEDYIEYLEDVPAFLSKIIMRDLFAQKGNCMVGILTTLKVSQHKRNTKNVKECSRSL